MASAPLSYQHALDWTPSPCQPFDPDTGQQVLASLRAGLSADDWDKIIPYTAYISNAAGLAPYLRRLMMRQPGLVVDAFADEFDSGLGPLHDMAWTRESSATMRALRRAKDRWALHTALRDLAGLTPVMAAAGALSRFAGDAIDAALACAWRAHRHTRGDTVSGLVVLAMGKLGAGELNYSSDIDLIVLYDPARLTLAPDADPRVVCVAITRTLISFLSDQTADGYVFRTDMRLRPDPGVTAVAVSVEAAENYYEGHGQTWERLAFIKAQAIAGDLAVGTAFLTNLRPFIWRRSLDYAAVEDVHQIREKITRAHGAGDHKNAAAFAGHNVKLGIGGIREIEFFAQTQQIIAGGKDASLRPRQTLAALAALARAGLVTGETSDALTEAYCFLRFVEHRLQMINDEQTHTIGTDSAELCRLAALCGFDRADKLAAVHARAIAITRTAYLGLFAVTTDQATGEEAGTDHQDNDPLDFTGPELDPETLAALAKIGFDKPVEADRLIRQWMRGSMAATRTDQSRRLLRDLIPNILTAMGQASDPYQALLAFDRFLAALPAGVQLFSMLHHHAPVLQKLMTLLTASPRLARDLSRHRHMVESLIENGRQTDIRPFSSGPALIAGISKSLQAAGHTGSSAPDFELVMHRLARKVGEMRFTIAADLVQGAITPQGAAGAFTAVARACLAALVPCVERAMAPPGGPAGQLAVLGFGAVGAGQMTFQSDLDLVFIYASDGPTQTSYFARIVRKIITILTTSTRDGVLYPVDMQLRPSGRAGPVATSLSAFDQYYDNDAWIWEVMALTKAQTVAGNPVLVAQISARIASILARKRGPADVAEAVIAMRQRLEKDRPALSVWDRKRVPGGQTDIEFLVQYLTLVSAEEVGLPPRPMADQLSFFSKNNLLTPNDAVQLAACYARNEAIIQYGRLGSGDFFSPKADGKALGDLVINACGATNHANAEATLKGDTDLVQAIFARTVKV
ncbi:MAG: bifunctional [glutamine synthetase] adenylyltransferase/[glutamine synthetase]-adenylyl-L-tyrosine phosphorylase [Pseudomonadota bacterium]